MLLPGAGEEDGVEAVDFGPPVERGDPHRLEPKNLVKRLVDAG